MAYLHQRTHIVLVGDRPTEGWEVRLRAPHQHLEFGGMDGLLLSGPDLAVHLRALADLVEQTEAALAERQTPLMEGV